MLKPGWTVQTLFAALALSWTSPAAAQFFYNQTADDQAKAALEEYRASRDAHLGVFEARRKTMDALEERLDTAITTALRAQRDQDVVEMLELSAEDQRQRLIAKTEDRIMAITGLHRSDLAGAAPGSPISVLLNEADLGTRINGARAYVMTSSFSESSAQERVGKIDGARGLLELSTVLGTTFSYRRLCETKLVSAAGGVPAVRSLPEIAAVLVPLGFDRAKAVQTAFALTTICNDAIKTTPVDAMLPADPRFDALKALAGHALTDAQDRGSLSDAVSVGLALGALTEELTEANAEIAVQRAKAETLRAAADELEAARKNGVWDKVSELAAKLADALGTAALPIPPGRPFAAAGTSRSPAPARWPKSSASSALTGCGPRSPPRSRATSPIRRRWRRLPRGSAARPIRSALKPGASASLMREWRRCACSTRRVT